MVGSVGPLFLGVGLPAPSRDLLAGVLAARLEGRDLPGRLSPPDNWHITIRYFGRIEEVTADRLLAELDQSDLGRRFTLELVGLGAFPNPRRATVLWAGVGRGTIRLGDLNRTAEESAQVVGLDPDERPYRPHLTLSRLRPDEDVRSLLAAVELPPIEFEVAEVTLFRSHVGPSTWYEPVEAFALD